MFNFDFASLPTSQSFATKNGSLQYYRKYPATSDVVMILIHGISEDSKYLYPLASFLSSNDLAIVYTPDLRGYGDQPERRGDVDYMGQTEDDLADLIRLIKTEHPNATLILAGHSGGGGTAIKFANGRHADDVHGYLLLAPHVGAGSPVDRPSDGTMQVDMKRIIALSVLNALGIRRWNHLPVMKINRQNEERHGGETLEMSFRLLISRSAMNHKKELPKLVKPTLVLAGMNDEVFYADRYESVFSQYTQATVRVIPNETHDGIIANDDVHASIKEWLVECILKH
ncbi:MAG: alpha/beta hydrolase [Tumebacillaceae bacterium]